MTDSELLQAMYGDMQSMKTDMQSMKTDMQSMKTDMQSMKADIQTLKADMQTTQADIQILKADMQTMNQNIASIELTLENETNRNIKIIAEGHTILYRRLDEALKVESEKEMLLIRVNRLENELRKVKEQIQNLEIA